MVTLGMLVLPKLSLAKVLRQGVASIMSFPLVLRRVKCGCYIRKESVRLSNTMLLSYFQVISSLEMARLTRSSTISSIPSTFAQSTLVKLVLGLTGKMPTPLMVSLDLRSLRPLTTCYHLMMSSSLLILTTIRVTWRVAGSTSASESLVSICWATMFLQMSWQKSNRGIWMKCVQPFSLRGGLLFLLSFYYVDSCFIGSYCLTSAFCPSGLTYTQLDSFLLSLGLSCCCCFLTASSSWLGLQSRLHGRFSGSMLFCLQSS